MGMLDRKVALAAGGSKGLSPATGRLFAAAICVVMPLAQAPPASWSRVYPASAIAPVARRRRIRPRLRASLPIS